MLRSLFSGVSGLRVHQTKMDAIGNNIANVNTYGYKAQRVTFKDSFYQTLSNSTEATDTLGGGNPSQIGYGAVVGSIDVLHTRGGFVPTGQPMDLFIEGEGYLVARDSSGNEAYTRVGNLNFDGSGNLVDANRRYICGYPIARYNESTAGSTARLKLDNVEMNFGAQNGTFFNGFRVVTENSGTGATLNLRDKIITINGGSIGSTGSIQSALRSMQVINGNLSSNINLNDITVSGSGGLTNNKSYSTTVSAGDGKHSVGDIVFETVPAQSAVINSNNLKIEFGDANGTFFNGYKIKTVLDNGATGTSAQIDVASKLITVTSKTDPIRSQDLQSALHSMKLRDGSGTIPSKIDFNLISVGGNGTSIAVGVTTTKATDGIDMMQKAMLDKSNGLQPIKKPGTLIDVNEDGIYDGETNGDIIELKGIKISENGIITGEDKNGQMVQIGQVCLADVPNPQALTLDGNSYLNAVSNMGHVTYSEPGAGTVGTLVSGGLENSNVDLANEFADMIMTQRGFQANSRIITVGDEMLQELVNLKR